MPRSPHQRLVWIFPLALVAIGLGYAIFFRQWIVHEQGAVPYSYKQFLLETVEGPRLLIDGGSNGLHSFDGALLEAATGLPVVILAEHAGFSTIDKAKRVLRYAHPGDILLLPYEWSIYQRSTLEDIYLERSKEELSYYYDALPLFDQLKRAYETPLVMVLLQIARGDLRTAEGLSEGIARLNHFVRLEVPLGPHGEAIETQPAEGPRAKQSCDQYLFGRLHPPALGDLFLATIEVLQELQARGVTVAVIPPVVVGDDCYTTARDHVHALWALAENALAAHGIPSFGAPEDRHFGSEAYLDTFYHLRPAARETATRWVLETLQREGILPTRDPAAPLPVWDPLALIEARRETVIARHLKTLPPWDGAKIETDFVTSSTEPLVLASGWYPPSAWGCWAEGKVSTILLRPHPTLDGHKLTLEAIYYHGAEETEIWLGDEFIAAADLSRGEPILLPAPFGRYADAQGLVRLRLVSHDPVSPLSLGDGTDSRRFKLGLKSIALE